MESLRFPWRLLYVWVDFSSLVGFLQFPPSESRFQLDQMKYHVPQILEAVGTVFQDFSASFFGRRKSGG